MILRTRLEVLFLLIFFFLLFPSKIFASDSDITINEFQVEPSGSSQWVELYNKGNDSLDISSWIIDDDGGSEKFTIPSGTTIGKGEFKVFSDGSFNLNTASSDTIKLLHNDSVIDSHTYDKSPGANKSIGRSHDGDGNWVVFSSPTKGSSNNSSTPDPTATPVPPTPTKAPDPTDTPKPAATSTPVPTLTPVKSPTPTPLKTIFPTDDPSVSSSSGEVLGANNVIPTLGNFENITPTVAPVQVLGSKETMFGFLFVGGGLVFLISGIIVFLWQRRKKLQKLKSL